jgi:hypothetical protein
VAEAGAATAIEPNGIATVQQAIRILRFTLTSLARRN